MKKITLFLVLFLLILCLTMILVSGCTSYSDADMAAVDKMIEINDQINRTLDVSLNAMDSGDLVTAKSSAAQLRDYIDQNLPEMQQLANNADTVRPGAQEFVLFLVDLRSSQDYYVKWVDYVKAKDYANAQAAANNGVQAMESARSHFRNAKLSP